jgi:hypothetical protein
VERNEAQTVTDVHVWQNKRHVFPLVEACAENLNKFSKQNLGQVDLKVSCHCVDLNKLLKPNNV